MLAQKLRISCPIFLVLGGLGLSFVPGLPRIARLQQRMQAEINLTTRTLNSLEVNVAGRAALRQYHRVLLDVLNVPREALTHLRHHDSFDDEGLRQQEAQLDLDEAKVKHIER